MSQFAPWRGLQIRHSLRPALALLCTIVMTPSLGGQNREADKIYKQLSVMPIHSTIEIRLLTGMRMRGDLLSFDHNEVLISGRTAPFALSDIRSVKRLDKPAGRKWNPLWGASGSWKAVAIGCGILLLVGIIAAKNTR